MHFFTKISKNDTNTCTFIFDFMKCKSIVKSGLQWLINEDKNYLQGTRFHIIYQDTKLKIIYHLLPIFG